MARFAKTYWAVVEGGPAEDEGIIDMPLGRLNAERGWWQKPDPDGQPAITKWKVLGRGFFSSLPATASKTEVKQREATSGVQLTWLAMEPVTGRTHQLRVHARALGWPIVGDNIYGNGPRFGEPRLHLHSREYRRSRFRRTRSRYAWWRQRQPICTSGSGPAGGTESSFADLMQRSLGSRSLNFYGTFSCLALDIRGVA